MLSPRLFLVRHGQSTLNAAQVLQGHADPPLTDVGRREAERLRPAFAGFDPNRVISSDLARARETAALLGFPSARTDPRWREIDVGSWVGRPLADFPPGPQTSWRGGPLAPPDGETWAQFQARVGAAVDALTPDGDWLVVCHGGVVRAALSHVTGADPQRVTGPPNTSVTVIRLDPLQLESYGWTPTSASLPQVPGPVPV
jgi:broad specificity phosphatase PhoE